jgi:mRNA interferase RelE/StbE
MYILLIKTSAEQDLRKLTPDLFERVTARALRLRDDPRLAGAVKLSGHLKGWRVRVGDYCILYQIDDEAKTVTIVRVKHRREVYR